VRLSVRDNGVGLPAGFDWRNAKSLGLRLVQMLAKQIGGTVDAKRMEGGGMEFCVEFPV
jgi:two-component sensor histidine kinase